MSSMLRPRPACSRRRRRGRRPRSVPACRSTRAAPRRRARVHVTGAEGSLGPARARRCSPTTPAIVDRLVDGRPTSSSTSAPATTTCGPGAGRASPTAPPRCSPTPTAGGATPPRAGVVGDGLRRLRQQPGAAHRGRHPAARRRVRLRPPAGDGRGDGRPLAAGRARAARSPCCARSWRWPPTARRRWPRALAAGLRPALRRGRPAGPVPPPRRPRRRRSSLAVDRRLDGVFNVAPDGWVAGERVRALTGARPRIRLPDRRRRGRRRAALAVPARPDPARAAQLHAGAVARRQRPAEGRTAGARR